MVRGAGSFGVRVCVSDSVRVSASVRVSDRFSASVCVSVRVSASVLVLALVLRVFTPPPPSIGPKPNHRHP